MWLEKPLVFFVSIRVQTTAKPPNWIASNCQTSIFKKNVFLIVTRSNSELHWLSFYAEFDQTLIKKRHIELVEA